MYVNGMPVIQRVWPQHYYFVKVLQQISFPFTLLGLEKCEADLSVA